jgi:hypothetical protein
MTCSPFGIQTESCDRPRSGSIRYVETVVELTDIAEGRVVDGGPAEIEAALLAEQVEIECRSRSLAKFDHRSR